MALCHMLRERRLALGVTQVELSDRLGLVSRSTLCNWEHGRHSPYLPMLVRWVAELGWELAVGEPWVGLEDDEL